MAHSNEFYELWLHLILFSSIANFNSLNNQRILINEIKKRKQFKWRIQNIFLFNSIKLFTFNGELLNLNSKFYFVI